jgi:hypothetical protein
MILLNNGMSHIVTKFGIEEYPLRNVTPIFNVESTEIKSSVYEFSL